MSGSASSPEAAAPAPDDANQPARPVAVVWCRQVDNEAESPGYTTIPEGFPGQRETVDVVRTVGHLTINVADTHDYWDPEPGLPLSYYPNLFLYPAYGGRYTCLGRMFLSKEDRPRLGMKTLVLSTSELLKLGGFGPSILRWYSSMGGPRGATSRGGQPPDPALYGLVGEGFLFHKGDTDPVLLVASDRWGATMRVILDLVRSLPTSLVSLGAILAFPYFLPQPRTDLKELQEKIPLSLAVMRVTRSEAIGPRHLRRLQAWSSSNLTVRDLAVESLPPTNVKGKETLPLVLQYVRDRNEDKLAPIRQRVDLVEVPKLRAHVVDTDHHGGKARRKEMWRIATAMESAALLLQRSRGRHVPVSAEAAKRAQEYLDVELDDNEGTPEPAVVPTPSDAAEADLTPPWSAPADQPLTNSGAREENDAVPVSTKDDPSLLPSPAAVPMLGLAVPGDDAIGPRESEIRRLVQIEVDRRIGDRGGAPPASPADTARTVELALAAVRESVMNEIDQRLLEAERRVTERLDRIPDPEAAPAASAKALEGQIVQVIQQQQSAIATLREEVFRKIETEQSQLRNTLASALAPELDRRVRLSVEPKLAELGRALSDTLRDEIEKSRRSAMEEVERAVAEIHERSKQAEEELRGSLTSQLDRHLREAADRELTVRESTEGRLREALEARLGATETHLDGTVTALEERLKGSLDARARELREWLEGQSAQVDERLPALIDHHLQEVEARWTVREAARTSELQEAQSQATADLQVRLQQHLEERILEGQEQERQKYLELLARMKREVDQTAQRSLDPKMLDRAIRERIDESATRFQQESHDASERKVKEAEERLRLDQGEAIQRLEQVETALEERSQALLRLESTVRTELNELDHRTQVLTDRLVPVVRKTWLKIQEISQTPGEPGEGGGEDRFAGLRKDLIGEIRRVEADSQDRVNDLRHRVESTIAHQGRVWLTLIHSLSRMTDDRQLAEGAARPPPPPDWQEEGEEGPGVGDAPRAVARQEPRLPADRSNRRTGRKAENPKSV